VHRALFETTTVLLSPRGDYLLDLPGYVEPTPLRTLLAYVATEAYRHRSYEAFRADPEGCARDGTRAD
jgi:thioredoxin-related protein